MIEYLNFEKSLGTDEVDVITIIEKIMTSFQDNHIPKKELQQIYNKLPGLKMKNVKKILTQQFFFTDKKREYYDFCKI